MSYRDRSIYFSFFHGLTDGGGETMFTHEVLGWYAHEVLGVPYEGAPPAPDMDAEPFEVLDDALARAGLADAQIDGMGSLGEEFLVEEELKPCDTVGGRHFIVHMDSAGFMAFARREHVKASAALCALYAAAVQRVHPNNTKPVRIALPTNMRSALGIPGTHRNAVMPPVMLEVGGCAKLSLHELAQSLNHLILERASDSAKLLAMRDMRDMEASMPAMPFAQMEQLLATYRGDDAHYTFNCSYVHRYTDEPFLELVEDASTIVHSYVGCTALLAMALPEHFTISLNQGGDTRAYVDAFVELLNAEGIEASLVGEATVRGAYVALRESLGLKAGNVL